MKNIQSTIQQTSKQVMKQPTTDTTAATVFPWQYQPVKKLNSHTDLGTYETYSLQLFHCCDGKRQPIASIDDISVDQEFVEQLALQFTLHQLSPVHFLDAVCDAITERFS